MNIGDSNSTRYIKQIQVHQIHFSLKETKKKKNAINDDSRPKNSYTRACFFPLDHRTLFQLF